MIVASVSISGCCQLVVAWIQLLSFGKWRVGYWMLVGAEDAFEVVGVTIMHRKTVCNPMNCRLWALKCLFRRSKLWKNTFFGFLYIWKNICHSTIYKLFHVTLFCFLLKLSWKIPRAWWTTPWTPRSYFLLSWIHSLKTFSGYYFCFLRVPWRYF